MPGLVASGTHCIIKRQAIYVLYNAEPCSCNGCCSGKAIPISYYECMFVALGIQHAMRMSHIVVIGGLSGSSAFFF